MNTICLILLDYADIIICSNTCPEKFNGKYQNYQCQKQLKKGNTNLNVFFSMLVFNTFLAYFLNIF